MSHEALITDDGKFVPVVTPRLAGECARKKGKRVQWDFVAPKRTLRQNARYWTVIVPAFSEYAGYEQYPERAEKLGKTPKDSAHRVLVAMLLDPVVVQLPGGQVFTMERSTTSLSVAEMSDLQDRAERFLISEGRTLPPAKEAD